MSAPTPADVPGRGEVEGLAKVIDGEIDGTIVTRSEHHPACQGDCRDCPIPVQDYGDTKDVARAILASDWLAERDAEVAEGGLAVARDLLQKVADHWDGRPLTGHYALHFQADVLDVLRAITPAEHDLRAKADTKESDR